MTSTPNSENSIMESLATFSTYFERNITTRNSETDRIFSVD